MFTCFSFAHYYVRSARAIVRFRWIAGFRSERGPPTRECGSLVTNRLLQLQLAAVYFWAAVDKTNADFLSGARLDQILHFHYDGSFLAPVILWTPLVVGAAVAVVIVEYFLAIGVLLRRWLPTVFFFGFALHLTFYYLLPVSTFSLTMMAMYLFLLPPSGCMTSSTGSLRRQTGRQTNPNEGLHRLRRQVSGVLAAGSGKPTPGTNRRGGVGRCAHSPGRQRPEL
jgi:hypothetical protein